MMKQCDIIKDLLPLYIDGVASDASAQLIEEHLAECPECAALNRSMQSSRCEEALQTETESVIAHHAKTQRKRAFTVGACIAGVLCIPVLVCLIVNLACGHALDWFFIVLTALMVFASLTVVPLVAEKQKGLYTILCFTGSLLLLLLTCALYTHGGWFFVAASSVLFGLAVVFMPYIAYRLPLPAFWQRNKGLLVFGVDTILFVIMLLCIGFYYGHASYWLHMPPIAAFNAGFVWIFFLLGRYVPANRPIRAGLCCIVTGAYLFSVNNIVNLILGEKLPWPAPHLFTWNSGTVDGNVKWLVLTCGILIGIVCIGVGIARQIRLHRLQKESKLL